MTDFLEQKRGEIAARLRELEPLVDEYARLQAAALALDGLPSASAAPPSSTAAPARATAARRGPGRPRGKSSSVKAPAAARRRTAGRRKGSGKRGQQAVGIISAEPGITTAHLAERMGIKVNYLYRVLPQLESEGRIAKDGRGWKVASA